MYLWCARHLVLYVLESRFTFSAILWGTYHCHALQINKLRLRDIKKICFKLPPPKFIVIFRISTWSPKVRHATVFVLQLYGIKWQRRLKAAVHNRIFTQARHGDIHTCTLPLYTHIYSCIHTSTNTMHTILIAIRFLKTRTQSLTENSGPTHAHILSKKWSGFNSRIIWYHGFFHSIAPRDGGVEVNSAYCWFNVSSSILSY